MTQKNQVLAALEEGKRITHMDALRQFGCSRLASLIHRLRQEGHQIERDMIETPNGSRVAKYRLAQKVAAPQMDLLYD